MMTNGQAVGKDKSKLKFRGELLVVQGQWEEDSLNSYSFLHHAIHSLIQQTYTLTAHRVSRKSSCLHELCILLKDT